MAKGRKIENPHWANSDKTLIFCQFVYDDDRPKQDASVSSDNGENPDWIEIMDEYGIKGVNKISDKLLAVHNERKSMKEQRVKEQTARREKEMLYAAKMTAFEMNEVKNSKNTIMKGKIRKAKHPMEVQVYTTALVMMELEAAPKDIKKLLPKKRRKSVPLPDGDKAFWYGTPMPEMSKSPIEEKKPEKKKRKPRAKRVYVAHDDKK